MTAKYHINPRFRAYGKARLDVTLRARDENEWQQMWREPMNNFPFKFGSGWKFCFEYRVEDFAAEVGFFIDVLGFTVRAFSPHYGQFSSPGGELCIGVLQAGDGEESTPPDSIRLQLQIRDLENTHRQLETRNVVFEKSFGMERDGESSLAGFFRTPHGVRIDLWEQPTTATYDTVDDADDYNDYDDSDEDEFDDLSVDYRMLDNSSDDEPIDSETTEDDPLDDQLNLNIAELDEDEADRLIDELLGLTEETDTTNENLDGLSPDDELIETELGGEGADEPDSEAIPRPKAMDWKPGGRSQPSIGRGSRLSAATSRNRNATWPKADDRRNGELSYEEIDDEY